MGHDGREDRAEVRREAVRGVMLERDWSQKQWCDLAGIDNTSALGNFLSGRSRSLTLETLEPLALAAGVTVSALIGEKEKVPIVAAVTVDNDALAIRFVVKFKGSERPIEIILREVDDDVVP